jgi:16S rRNA processing protein RimM
VLGPRGRRGEVAAELHTSFPERFADRRELSGLAADGSRRELRLEEHWFHKGHVVLKFAGVESISDAERLAGIELQIPGDERVQLEAGAAYTSELIGCEVVNQTLSGLLAVGSVAEIQFGAGEAPLLVVRAKTGGGEKEFLVPYAQAFLRRMDLPGRRIEVELPDGLLDLQTPLTEEEKQRQKMEATEARSAGGREKK